MRTVVKVGGSLLSRPDLQTALRQWIADELAGPTLMLFGGGELIDAIRRLDKLRPGESDTVHWECVRLLDTTFRMATAWFPDWPSVDGDSPVATDVWDQLAIDLPTIVAVRAFYYPSVQSSLPCTWDTTTDAIAAEWVVRSQADQLVLLKSCEVDPNDDPETLAAKGIVDEAFPLVASGVKRIRVEKLPVSSG